MRMVERNIRRSHGLLGLCARRTRVVALLCVLLWPVCACIVQFPAPADADIDAAIDAAMDASSDTGPRNSPPVVSAGPDMDVPSGECVLLSGDAFDDGLPIPPGRMTFLWHQVAGPGQVDFQTPDATATQATFPVAGTYQLALTASDGAADFTDYASVRVRDDTDVTIPYAEQAPVLDGELDTVWTSQGTAVLIEHLIEGSVTDSADLSANARLLWTSASLWVYVAVNDDLSFADGGNALWGDDSVELYLDAGADRLGSYGADDYQYVFRPLDHALQESKHDAVQGVQWACTQTTTHYRCEIMIPWDTLGQRPENEWFLGISIAVNDDDDGGGREAQLGWWHTANNAHMNPSILALARMERGGCEPR